MSRPLAGRPISDRSAEQTTSEEERCSIEGLIPAISDLLSTADFLQARRSEHATDANKARMRRPQKTCLLHEQ